MRSRTFYNNLHLAKLLNGGRTKFVIIYGLKSDLFHLQSLSELCLTSINIIFARIAKLINWRFEPFDGWGLIDPFFFVNVLYCLNYICLVKFIRYLFIDA